MAQSLNHGGKVQLVSTDGKTLKPTKSVWTDRNMCNICTWCLSKSRIASVGRAFCHRKLLFWCTESLLGRLHLGWLRWCTIAEAFAEASWSRCWKIMKIDILSPIKHPLKKSHLTTQEFIHEHCKTHQRNFQYLAVYLSYLMGPSLQVVGQKWGVCCSVCCSVCFSLFRRSVSPKSNIPALLTLSWPWKLQTHICNLPANAHWCRVDLLKDSKGCKRVQQNSIFHFTGSYRNSHNHGY